MTESWYEEPYFRERKKWKKMVDAERRGKGLRVD